MGWLKAELNALWKDFDWLCILVFSWMVPLGVLDSYGYGHQKDTALGYLQKSSLGYFKSLSFWVIPTLFFMPHFILKTRAEKFRPKRMALVWTVLSILVMGGILDCVFGWRAFRFDPINGNYLGFYVPAVGEEYLGTPGIPLEEFLFYFLGALDIVLLYHWASWRFVSMLGHAEPPEPPKRGRAGLLKLSRGAFVWGLILIGAGVPLKLYYGGPGDDVFPMYYTFLILVGFIPVMLIYQSVKSRVDWIAFTVTSLAVIGTSGLYEIGLAIPHHWWGYAGGAMIGDMLDVVQTGPPKTAVPALLPGVAPVSGIAPPPGAHHMVLEILGRQSGTAIGPWPVPVEVMLVWIIIPFFCIFAFELLTALMEERQAQRLKALRQRIAPMRKAHLAVGAISLVIFPLTGLWLSLQLFMARPGQEGMRMMLRADHIYLFMSGLLNLMLGLYYVDWQPGAARTFQRLGSVVLCAAPLFFLVAFFRDSSHVMLDPRDYHFVGGDFFLLLRERPWTLAGSAMLTNGLLFQLIGFARGNGVARTGFRENKGLQNALLVWVEADRSPEALLKLGKFLDKKGRPPFQKMAKVHMASVALLGRDPGGDPDFKPALLFAVYFDGPLDGLIRPLWDLAGPWFELLYASCPGYPTGGFRAWEGFRDFLLAHSLRYNTFYSAYPGCELDAIRENLRLRKSLGEAADSGKTDPGDLIQLGRGLMPTAMRLKDAGFISRFLRAAVRRRAVLGPLLLALLLVLLFASTVARFLFGGIVALNLLFFLVVLLHEAMETCPEESPVQCGRFPKLPQKVRGQNQVIMLFTVKGSPFRRLLFKGVLWIYEFAARHFYNRGDFGGISSIHFLNFTLLDGGRRMLFLSHFDGGVESYLCDFVERNSPGLTFIGSNTMDFPRTWGLFFRGARDEPVFRDWIRKYLLPSAIFYSAHDVRSTRELLNDIEIRKGVDQRVSGGELEVWARRL